MSSLTHITLIRTGHTPLQSNEFKPTQQHKHIAATTDKRTVKLPPCVFHTVVDFIQKLTVFWIPAQLHSSSLPHHCKHVSSAHSLSVSPPTASGQSQYRSSPVCHLPISLIVHQSHGSSVNCPGLGPIGSLWVKGYCWSEGGGVSQGNGARI